MNKFEAILLISPEVSKTILNDNLKNFEEIISNNAGKIKNTEDWGLRDLSYVINNFKKAFYKYYQIEIDGSNISNIKKIINQNDNIIRHLFIRVNEHQELPTNLNYEKN
ncbi:MAG: 30S ribosomal protein S6 [Alphaproteobacteria bacterium]